MQTVVFADIVGSTRIFEQLGDGAASRLVTELVGDMGQIVAHNNGRVVKALGDGLFAVFPGVVDAICASIDIQQQTFARPKRADGASVQVQIGLDAGDVVEIDGDCFGDTVNSAAWLADLAGAAQILTTENVWGAH